MEYETLCVQEGFVKKYFKAAFVIMSLIIGGLYVYALREQFRTDKTEMLEQCTSELESVKRELEAVMEYKSRIDKLLTHTQKNHETDMNRFNNVMQHCFAISQQTFLCQNNFNQAQIKCNKLEADFEEISKELEAFKDVKKIN